MINLRKINLNILFNVLSIIIMFILFIVCFIVNAANRIEKSSNVYSKTNIVTSDEVIIDKTHNKSTRIIDTESIVNSIDNVISIIDINYENTNIYSTSTDFSIDTIEDSPNENITEVNEYVSYDNIYYADGFNMMCYVVSHEVGNCSYESKKAVAHTILNRVNSELFPDTVYDVLIVPGQYDAIWDSYYCGQYVPTEDTINACIEALNEWDFTYGATYYYNPNICGYMDWFESQTLCYIDDNGQRFFK